MEPIPSTAEILALKIWERIVDERWVEWAYQMMLAGFDTENLVMLAGETTPYNQFEVLRLADKVFEELGLDYSNHEQVFVNYISYLIDEVLDGKKTTISILTTIKEFYTGWDINPLFHDFAMLYWAWDDLKYADNQYYWPGATRSNFDEVVKNYFVEWKEKHC